MRYKKILMLAILLVGLLTVSAVSAAENINDDVVGVEENEGILEENKLAVSAGTFTDLANQIAKTNTKLNLDRDYSYTSSDSNYQNGIVIDKSIVINGNGYTINGNNQARAFNVTAPNVVISNINFVDSFSAGDGGAIYWDYDADEGALLNCNFVNCSAHNSYPYDHSDGGAVYWGGNNGALSGCSFIDCYANYGGSVCWSRGYGTLSNCNFISSSSNHDGGAVRWTAGHGIITNCSFIDSFAGSGGGAVSWYHTIDCILTDCKFLNSKVSSGDGGAVRWYGDGGALSGCSFINSYASDEGGAIDWDGKDFEITNSNFVNSTAKRHAGAICVNFLSYNGIIANCSFMNSSGGIYSAGAILWDSNNGLLTNCDFANSYSDGDGGAVYWGGKNGNIVESSFKNCQAKGKGNGLYFEGENCSLIFATLDDGSDWYSEKPLVVINKMSTVLNAADVSTSYGASKNLVVTLKDSDNNLLAGEQISIVLNNVKHALKTNSKGKASLALPTNLAPNTYRATISYEGSRKYNSSKTSANIVVAKAKTSISAVYTGNEIIATLTNDANDKPISGASITIKLNNEKYTAKSNSKGQAKLSVADLSSGTATISYAGNSKYKSSSTSIEIVPRIDISISASYDANNNEIVATLTNEATGKAVSSASVHVIIKGETTTIKTDTKGQAKFSAAGLPLGTNTAIILFAGNSKYNPASTIITFDVKTKVIVTDVYAYSDRIVAKLTNGATGKTIANANMIVEINGVKYDAKSDNKGQLTFNTKGLNRPSAYDLTISYRGNDRYTASTATVAVDLNKANMMITTNYHANKQKMVATLKNSKTGKAVSNANMIIDLNGVKTTYKSNDQGKITLPTADWAPRTYVGTVTYPGNARYNSISAAFKIEI